MTTRVGTNTYQRQRKTSPILNKAKNTEGIESNQLDLLVWISSG